MTTALVTGGRNYADRAHVYAVLDRLHAEHGIARVIHGACGWDAGRLGAGELRGDDGLADAWAISRGVRVVRVPAHWTRDGYPGGPIRNGVMVRMKPDIVVVFPGDKGTKNCLKQATRAGLVIVREDQPRDAVIERTGVFATTEEVEKILALKREAASTPVVKVVGKWLHEQAHDAFMDAIDRCAVAHGLPAPATIDGEVNHYGMTNDREFTRYVPEEENKEQDHGRESR